jgi:D-alanyl-D-alanine carboxypeptidase
MHKVTTSRDLLRLLAYTDRYPVLQKVWTADRYTVTVEGDKPRTMECASKSMHPDLDDHYHSLGRKGGSLMSSRTGLYVYNLVSILEIPKSEDRLAVVALYALEGNKLPNNRFKATRQIADIAMAKYKDPKTDASQMSVCCDNAIAAVLPANGGEFTVLYEKNADEKGRPMSISKVLTAICVLDHITDLSARFTYHELDTNIGGFYIKDYLPGDQVTYQDALYALMLESSNVTAQALARSVGQLIK